jgi:hypothetical protein
MDTRTLWREIMHYGEFDRMPVLHWRGWPETEARWRGEGMPEETDPNEYFNAAPLWAGVGVNLDLFPLFEEEVIEETAEYRIFRDPYGVIQQDWKHKSCIPHYTGFTLKSAQEWPEFKKRLQPDPARIPDNLDEQIAHAEAAGLPVIIGTASLMGWPRNWMGVPNMCYMACETPGAFTDMADTIATLVCWGIDQVIPRMKAPPDMGFGWEDICGRNGPLVNRDIFLRSIAPAYRRIRNKLEEHGVTLYGIDTDGHVEPLLGEWLDAGVNVMFPIEIGAWKADPMALRKQFGKELHICGGIDKLALEKGRAEIDAEIERRVPLMKEGGFVPLPDHLITPGVPLEDYKYYLDGIRNLRF